jgi:hypothetical protein
MARYGFGGDQWLDSNGKPLSGGKLYFFETGTSTAKATYSDVAMTIENSNPVVLDSAGRQGDIFFTGAAKIIIKSAANVVIDEVDPVYPVQITPSVVVSDNAGVSVDSYASLLAIDSDTDGSTCTMLGFTTPGDGGGGVWYWDAASVETVNVATTVKPTDTVGAGRWKRIYNEGPLNVKWFGATGDGVSDDYTAIDAAIQYCTTNDLALYIPTGTYYIPNTTSIRFSGNITLIGDGPELSILFYDDSFSGVRNDFILSNDAGNVHFSGVGFSCDWGVGDVWTKLSQMIVLYAVAGSTAYVNNCAFKDGRFMLLVLVDYDEVTVTDCTFDSSVRDGCRVIGSKSVTVANNYFINVNDDAIAVHTENANADPAKADIVVTGNKIIDSQGIAILGGKHCVVSNNVITRPLSRGIQIGEGTEGLTEGGTVVLGATVTGNVVTDLFKGSTFGLPSGDPYGLIAIQGLEQQPVGAVYVDWGEDALDPYPYFYQNEILPTDIRTGNYQFVIANNVCSRTLPYDVDYSTYGYGERKTRDGYDDPFIESSSFCGTAGITLTNGASIARIEGNVISGVFGSGIHLSAEDQTDGFNPWRNVAIRNNTIYDIRQALGAPQTRGIYINGGGTVDIVGNTLDIDPYLVNANRLGLTGTWNPGDFNLVPAIWNDKTGVISGHVSSNSFKNCGTMFLGSTIHGLWHNNIAYCDPTGLGETVGNKGISNVIAPEIGVSYVIWDCDQTSATFNSLLNNCPEWSVAIPADGKYVKGTIVKKTFSSVTGSGGSQYVVTGWIRLTTGSAHVLNTDWAEMRTLTGT